MECYKQFAHIYDELINSDVDYSFWANRILSICDKSNVNRKDYLDLACGTGNITEKIGEKFDNTWAVDLSYDMLTEAEIKLRKKGLKVNLICQDLSNLSLNKKFDLITCCLDSTNYILEKDKLRKYFEGVYKALKDEGIFIFDINSYYKLSNILGNNIFTYDDEGIFYVWENEFEEEKVSMYITFFVKQNEKYERFDEIHTERAYKQKYLDNLLESIGFEIIGKLNNYENELISKESERIVYIIKKHKF